MTVDKALIVADRMEKVEKSGLNIFTGSKAATVLAAEVRRLREVINSVTCLAAEGQEVLSKANLVEAILAALKDPPNGN